MHIKSDYVRDCVREIVRDNETVFPGHPVKYFSPLRMMEVVFPTFVSFIKKAY